MEIVGDFGRFRTETSKKLNAALRDVGEDLDVTPIERKVGDSGGRAGSTFAQVFEREARRKFDTAVFHVVDDIADDFDSDRSRGRFRRSISSLGSFLSSMFINTFQGISALLPRGGGGGIAGLFGQLGEGFASSGSAIGGFLIQAGLAIIIIPTLVAVVATLVSQLVGLIFLLNALPAAAALALGAIIPLVIAFQGMGDAISAIASGDKDKINEALKKLTPAARHVAQEIQTLLPLFRRIREATQEAFFKPLVGGLVTFFNRIGEGRISQGFANVAKALGDFVSNILAAASSPAFQALGGVLFGTKEKQGSIAAFFNAIGPPLKLLLEALADAARAVMPLVVSFAGALGAKVTEWADSLKRASEDGSLNRWLLSAAATASSLWDLLKEVLGVFIDIFKQTDEGGRRFLDDVTDAVKGIRQWLESPDGKRGLATMIELAQAFAAALKLALEFLGGIISALSWIDSHTPGWIKGGASYITSGGNVPQSLSSSGGQAISGGLHQHAEGGIVNKPTFTLVGEAGAEAIVPLSKPGRAAEVMSQAGLLDFGNMLGAGTGGITVHVYLGTREITDVLDARVERAMAGVGRALGRGPRSI